MKRMMISLADDAATAVEVLAEHYCCSQVEIIRKAIATETYFQRELENGGKILIEKADGTLREVIFR